MLLQYRALLPLLCLISSKAANIEEDTIKSTNLIFYYGPKFENFITYNLEEEGGKFLTDSNCDSSKATTLYVHGYMENQTSQSIRTIVDAYNTRGDNNLLVLDWAATARVKYVDSAFVRIKILGRKIADIILEAFNGGLDRNRFHCVGHSLGGQMAGIIGRQVIAKTNGKIKLTRISALDPAFPGFLTGFLSTSVNKNDASFVDIIHTDAGFYGYPFSGGTADFWPNGGVAVQPGCPPRDYVPLSDNDLCSHWQSWVFWAKSVADKGQNPMLGYPTKSWNEFKENGGENVRDQAVPMGIDCPLSASGNYYLRTNSTTNPFAGTGQKMRQ